jgi:hypothetical protein
MGGRSERIEKRRAASDIARLTHCCELESLREGIGNRSEFERRERDQIVAARGNERRRTATRS